MFFFVFIRLQEKKKRRGITVPFKGVAFVKKIKKLRNGKGWWVDPFKGVAFVQKIKKLSLNGKG